MIRQELDQVIDAVEKTLSEPTETSRRMVLLVNSHRWEQTLRLLKFYRAKWNEFESKREKGGWW